MASQSNDVYIANRALQKLGAKTIISFNDNTPESDLISVMYYGIRDTLLNDKIWSFSIKSASLPSLVEPTILGSIYTNQFELPSDFIRLISINNQHFSINLSSYIGRDDSLYSFENNRILTSLNAALYIRYVSRITDTTKFTPSFVEAFACRLAAECCETITNSASKKKLLWEEYDQLISAAIKANMIEIPAHNFIDGSLISSRFI